MKLWILGAGFSRRLGGPLLADLISESELSVLRHRFPGTWLEGIELDVAVAGLRAGLNAGMWQNPEAFMAALASGDRTWIDALLKSELPSAHYEKLREPSESQGYMTPEELLVDRCWSGATRLVAAQCCDFAERAKSDPEGWLPYDRWAKTLSCDDVIVSFNYDNVVESVLERNRRGLWVPNPRMPTLGLKPSDKVALLKLHGSVTFRDTVLYPPEPDTVANLDRNPAYIATPGRMKRDDCLTDFDGLWELAEDAIKQCSAVCIIGYSCPPTDEMPKALLIDSLLNNPNRPIVELVLGDDNASAARLEALLKRFSVVINTRLFAQDYLSISGAGTGWRNSDVFPGMLPDDSPTPGLILDD
jgi:hypothetical protein